MSPDLKPLTTETMDPVPAETAGPSGAASGHRETLNLWIINEYASPANAAGITRHATLAMLMARHGIRTRIFASPGHYWTAENLIDDSTDTDDVRFVPIPVPTATTNGLARAFIMLRFSLGVLVKGLGSACRPRPDVIIGSSPHPVGALAGLALARRYGVPFVLEIRDLWPASLVELLHLSATHPFVRALALVEHVLYHQADLIVALLPGAEQHIRTVCSRATPVMWVPNGVDVSSLPAVVEPSPERRGFTILYAGAHGIPNSLGTVLDAAASLQELERDLLDEDRTRFILVGEGKEKTRLQAHADSLGLRNVEFRPAVAKSQVPRLLALGDALVITAVDTPLYRFGISPNKLFDYLASGRPVLMGFDTPWDPVRDSRSGITFRPEDPTALVQAAQALRGTPVTERREMGRRGRAHVESEFNLVDQAARLATALRDRASRGR